MQKITQEKLEELLSTESSIILINHTSKQGYILHGNFPWPGRSKQEPKVFVMNMDTNGEKEIKLSDININECELLIIQSKIAHYQVEKNGCGFIVDYDYINCDDERVIEVANMFNSNYNQKSILGYAGLDSLPGWCLDYKCNEYIKVSCPICDEWYYKKGDDYRKKLEEKNAWLPLKDLKSISYRGNSYPLD